MIARGEESVRPEFVVAQNWFEELNHRVPTDGRWALSERLERTQKRPLTLTSA